LLDKLLCVSLRLILIVKNNLVELKFWVIVAIFVDVEHDRIRALRTRVLGPMGVSRHLLLVCAPSSKLPRAVGTSHIEEHPFGISVLAIVCGLKSEATEGDLLREGDLDPGLAALTVNSAPFAPTIASLVDKILRVLSSCPTTPLNGVLALDMRLVFSETFCYQIDVFGVKGRL
jgi:hypothetical protein